MPIVSRDSQPKPLELAQGNLPQPQVEEAPGIYDVLGAAFRTDNLVGSAVANNDFNGAWEVDYNPWEDIAGTPYEKDWEAFSLSRSKAHTDALKTQVDRENADRDTLEAAGGLGVLASMGASIVDPTILLPVGGTVKKIEGGYSLLKSGLSVGAATGAAVALQEVGLQDTQVLRTGEESAINIGGGIILGGVLGGAASKLLSAGERKAATAAYDRLNEGELVQGGGLSAADTSKLTIGDLSVDGRDAAAVAKATALLSPGLRLQQSPSTQVRALAQQVAEGSMYQGMNAEGRTLGPAVERLSKNDVNKSLQAAQTTAGQAYRDMRRAGVNMGWSDFNEEIGKAMRRNDSGTNEYVERAAGAWRKSVADPVFDRLKQAGVLEEGDRTQFAASYFPRRYNKDYMVANRPEIIDKFAGYFDNYLGNQFTKASEKQGRKLGRLDARLSDLTMGAEERALLVDELSVTKLDDPKAQKALEQRLEDLRTGIIEDAVEVPEGSLLAKVGRTVDNAVVDAKLAELKGARVKVEREFADRWEIQRLGENLEDTPTFTAISKQIAEEIFERITGTNYGDSSSLEPEYLMPIKRGPMIERTLPIPDEQLEKMGVLVNNAEDVMSHYARVGFADAHLTDMFGSPTMVQQFEDVKGDYRKLYEGAKDEKARLALRKREERDVGDLRAIRDLVRGVYKSAENASSFGRISRALTHFNYIRSMGAVVLSSLTDLYRPAMVHGLGKYMSEGIAPLITNLDAVKLSVKEAKLAGLMGERILQHRVMSMADMGDPYARGNTVERFLENASRYASKWNGIALFTDFSKGLASMMSQNRLLDPAADKRLLAFLGIDGDMQGRILRQFDEHGETLDGVKVANTERWNDPIAVTHYRAAVGKDVDSTIVTPGIADVPLFSRTPTGRMLLQFKSFTLSANQKVLIRGLQEDKTRFLSSMVGMSAIGMLVASLRAWRSGDSGWEKFKEQSANPGYLVGEGLDASGIFSIPFDMANTVEKLTPAAGFKFNPLKTPMSWGGGVLNPSAPQNNDSVRFAMQSPGAILGGPTFGMAEDVFKAGGYARALAEGDEPTPGSVRAASRLIPYNSYLGMKEALQYFNEDSPYVE